ncbi:MAG TPA: hypothetical protein VE075_10755 [Thermoanaerobaculia bacterium]|nr:hypothetical protein [Thermoanaerobaculia bacterium]
MRGLAAVLRHELAERRLLLLVSPLLGLLALAAPLLPGAADPGSFELRDTTALFLALALSGLTALLLGPSVVGADLAARRLAFFFSRPLPGAAIWAGKLGAAAICAWSAALLALLPSLLVDVAAGAGGGLLHNALIPRPLLALWFGALPVLVLAAHFGGVILRTRSPWLVLDLAAAVTAAAIVLTTVRRLQYWGALDAGSLELLGVVGLGLAGLGLLAASAVQVIAGRTDPVRGHRGLSLTFAGISLATVFAFAAVAQGWIAIGPQDLDSWSFAAVSPGQAWIALSGPAPGPPGYGASFLLHTASGRAVRTRFARGPDDVLPVAFSADGRRAVWTERGGGKEPSAGVLLRLDLDRPASEPVRTPIVESAPPSGLAISPHGDRFATVSSRRVAVYELDGGRLLAAHAFESLDGWPEAVFIGEDRLRILIPRYLGDGVRVVAVVDLDLTSRKAAGVATLPDLGWLRSLSPDSGRIAFNSAPGAVTVIDLAGGRQVFKLSQRGARVSASYLADGRLARQVVGPAGGELILLDGDGQRLPDSPRFRLPRGAALGWIVQADADRLLALEVLQGRRGAVQAGWKLLDLRRGRTLSVGPRGLQPLVPHSLAFAGKAPLFTDGTHLLRIDLATGNRQVLGPARPFRTGYQPPM